jgi:ATP-dependent exoDNAse (exonuclease V) beta subunit
VLSGEAQAQFVPMAARTNAVHGGVYAMPLSVATTKSAALLEEMEAFTQVFHGRIPTDFGAESWGQIAVLSGLKKSHLSTLQRIMANNGVPCQLRLRGRQWSAHVLFRWYCGVVRVLTCPTDSVEIVYLLREVFEISDALIARFFQKYREIALWNSLIKGTAPNCCEDRFKPITNALYVLFKLRNAIEFRGIAHALDEIEEVLQLRHRAYQCEPNDEHDKIISAIFYWASESDTIGESFIEFSSMLLEKFWEPCEPEASDPEKIQIDTLHGSKGLEWPIVILPFCTRNISVYSENPPIFDTSGQYAKLLLTTNSDAFDEFQSRDANGKLQTLQRLLYVAMTRAKKNIILSYNEKHLAEKVGQLSPQNLMGINFSQLKLWEPCDDIANTSLAKKLVFANAQMPNNNSGSLQEIVLPARWCAVRHSRDNEGHARYQREEIPRTGSDSAIVDECGLRAENARLYGLWWHATMQFFPWSEERGVQIVYVDEAVRHAPNPERARNEMAKLFQSQWFCEHCGTRVKVLAEWPFEIFNGKDCARGIIDLLFVDADEGVVEVVDWKTDLLQGLSVSDAMIQHAAQLQHYERFLHQMLWKVTNLGVYFSCLGEFFPLSQQKNS